LTFAPNVDPRKYEGFQPLAHFEYLSARGTAHAFALPVAARSFSELDVWQLSNELKLGVYELLSKPVVQRDLDFRDQMQDSARSAPRNIAEGFGRYLPREFSQYLRVANGSLMETSNHLLDGYDRGYFTKAEIEPLLILARRSSAAVTRLLRYLRTVPPNGPSTGTQTVKPKKPRTVEPCRLIPPSVE
jgi:four helix bundle protein